MFSSLTRPKWEHPDPAVRRRAIERKDLPDDALAKIASDDDEPELRCAAIERLQDLDVLIALRDRDAHTPAGECANRRVRSLLAGPLEEGPVLEHRLRAIQHVQDAGLAEYLARAANSADVRRAALQRVASLDVLCEVAANDPVPVIRDLAFGRIDSPEGWKRVAREARGRDKGLARTAQTRLDEHERLRVQRSTATSLCEQLELLAEQPPAREQRTRYAQIEQQWRTTACDVGDEIQKRYQIAAQVVAAKVAEYQSTIETGQAICRDLRACLADVESNSDTESNGCAPAEHALQLAHDRWAPIAAVLDPNDPVKSEYESVSAMLRTSITQRTRDAERILAARSVLAEARDILAASEDPSQRTVDQLLQRWAQVVQPDSPSARQGIQNEFDDISSALRKRLKDQRLRREQALEEAAQLIPELKTALSQGRLREATSLRDRVHHRLELARGFDNKRHGKLTRQLRATDTDFNKLSGWRRWGSAQAREHLLTEIEGLKDCELAPAEVAAKVRAARESWKQIDRDEGPAPQSLWSRFDQACTAAYRPYQQQLEEQARQQHANLAAKESLCAELENLERDTDWENPPWPEIDRSIKNARRSWQSLGLVPRSSRRSLSRRFRQAMDVLTARLREEQNREVLRRENLIREVEQLASSDNARGAIGAAKRAQRDWNPSVRASPRKEQALWRAFRAACDGAFQRADAERTATQQRRVEDHQRKVALCDELEAMLGDDEVDINRVAGRLRQAKQEWAQIGSPGGREQKELERRYARIEADFRRRQTLAAAAAVAAVLEGMRQRAELCARIEDELLSGGPDEPSRQALLDQTREGWLALPALESEMEKPLRERFDRACQALSGDEALKQSLLDQIGSNLDRAQEICLEAEVLAGIDSPPEFAAARLEMQVARLSRALQQRAGDLAGRSDRLGDLFRDWYRLGPLSASDRRRIAERLQRAHIAARTG